MNRLSPTFSSDRPRGVEKWEFLVLFYTRQVRASGSLILSPRVIDLVKIRIERGRMEDKWRRMRMMWTM